ERIADIFNYYCFDGEQTICPEEVQTQEREESIVITNSDHKTKQVVERIRDILAIAKKNGTVFVMLGIENQEHIHYGMPVRNMLYDSLTYARQIEEKTKENRKNHSLGGAEFLSGLRKDEKLTPVVTLVLYYGLEPWDGPRSLLDMLDMDQVPASIWPYVQNQYRLNLLEINQISDFDKFHTDIKEVLQLLSCKNGKNKMQELIEQNESYQCLPIDAAQVIAVFFSSNAMLHYVEKKEGNVDMGNAIDEMIQDGVIEGENRGREFGIQVFILDNLEEGIPYDRIQMKLQKRFELTPEVAEQYLEKYSK
ncbi:MAG: hypothetical protein ACI4CT_04485, partial [Lachnospiraceae bacterium]